MNWFKKNKISTPAGIIVMPSPLHGNGVFASTIFKPGAVIETAPAILMENMDKEFLRFTMLYNYYFVVGDDQYPVALGLGNSSLYNHAYKANAVYTISIKDETIQIKAYKNIFPGDEITLNYNGAPNDNTPVYFVEENNLIK